MCSATVSIQGEALFTPYMMCQYQAGLGGEGGRFEGRGYPAETAGRLLLHVRLPDGV